MTSAADTASQMPQPFFHPDSGTVRFWVRIDSGEWVGASVRKETLHFHFKAGIGGADALQAYVDHQAEIDAAVRRRVATGSIEPVMLREFDLTAPPAR